MRLTWAQLEAMLDGLTEQLHHGKLSVSEYVHDWDELMKFAGWTWHEFVCEVDSRWTTEKKASHPRFMC